MNFIKKILFLFLIFPLISCFWFLNDEEIFENLKKNEEKNKIEEEKIKNNNNNNKISFSHVPYEIKSHDERLTKEASIIKEMSLLDSCYHKIMMEMDSTCSKLNEEEISKLSVNLLNCQSLNEGRPTYPCTNQMTIKECTEEMDPPTWNAYQIVSNRARAVCYQIRQQQFRFKTELTVNQLLQSSEAGINSLKNIESSHVELRQITEETVKNLLNHQNKILEEQQQIQKQQQILGQQVSLTTNQLKQQNKNIVDNNRIIINITEKIHSKLEKTSDQIKKHSEEEEKHHDKIINNIKNMTLQTNDVFIELIESKKIIKEIKNDSEKNMKSLIENIKLINKTVIFAVYLIEKSQKVLNEKINFFIKYTGKDLTFLITTIIQIIFLFFLIIILSFFSFSPPLKLLIILIIIINLTIYYHYNICLSCLELSYFIISFIIFHNIIPWRNIFIKKEDKYNNTSINGSSSFEIQKTINMLQNINNGVKKKEKKILDSLKKRYNDDEEEKEEEEENEKKAGKTNYDKRRNSSSFLFSTEIISGEISPNHCHKVRDSFPLSPSRMSFSSKEGSTRLNSTMNKSLKLQCSSLTKKGKNCKRMCREGSFYCYYHQNNQGLEEGEED